MSLGQPQSLNSDLQKYVHASRYARYLDDKGRRETWQETVTRYVNFFCIKFPEDYPGDEVYHAIHNLDVMPSMRALMTAGPALERDNVAGYNCSYKSVDHPRVFDEIMYILLCGTGVGFSVERQFVSKLPEVPENLHETGTTIVVHDSKIGWAKALRELVGLLYSGQIPRWDVSGVRPAGERLKTFGGRASGPSPLVDLFRFFIHIFTEAQGRKLNSVEVHDLVCKIADVVVVGGVRRSALLSLSNLTDERMQRAKTGQWWEANGQRALANNSVAYTEKPDMGIFLREGMNLYESKSGERGMFNRVGAKASALASGRRDADHEFGCNPCAEIVLRDGGLCNLSEVVVRPDDTLESLTEKVRIATIIGTFQSTLTNFRYLRPVWRKNAEEERLLGVSFTGIMDHPVMSGQDEDENALESWLIKLKQVAIETNREWAAILGIEPSAAITTVKPSGTVSQLVDSSSGIHPRYSPYYIRTVRADKKDPLAQFMVGKGFPVEDDVTKPEHNYVFSFPVKSPDHAVTKMGALEQLNLYMTYKTVWCEHNVSQTVYYRDDEFLDVMAWVYEHWDDINGLSFLPHSDHVYRQAPYQPITEEEYKKALEAMPVGVDFAELNEGQDNTTSSQELSCVGGVCEVL